MSKMATRSSNRDLTTGSVSGHMMRMLVPFSVAVFAIFSAGLVDQIWVSRLGGEALAAIGFCAPVLFLANSVNIGLGAGTASVVSRSLGEGKESKAKRHASAALLLALLVMTLLAVLGLLIMQPLFNLMGASAETYSLIRQYMIIAFPGLAVLAIPMWSNMVLRSLGEAIEPTIIMISGAVLNATIDPFLIFGWGPFPEMGMYGAALATVIGNALAAALALWLVFYKRQFASMRGFTWHTLKRAWSDVCQVGLPAAGTNLINPLSISIATAMIAITLGDIYVGGFNAASRTEMLAIGVLFALSACIGPVAGQNGGAGKTERVREAFKSAFIIACVWSGFVAVVLFFAAPYVSGWFVAEDADPANVPIIREAVENYLKIVPVSVFGYGCVIAASAGLNALGRPSPGVILTAIRSFALYVPLIWLGLQFGGIIGAYLGIAAANVLSGVITLVWTLKRAPMEARKTADLEPAG